MMFALVVSMVGSAAAIGGLQEISVTDMFQGSPVNIGHWVDVTMSSDGSKAAATTGMGGTADFVWFSSDADTTWTKTSEQANLVAMSRDGSKMIATIGGATGNKIRVSSDDGATWSDTGSPSDKQWNCLALSADGTKMVAAADTDSIFVSSDGGTTWTDSGVGPQKWEAVAMSADGTKGVIAHNDGKLWSTTDGFSTITEVAASESIKWRDIAMTADGSKLVAATQQQGIFVGPDPASLVRVASADHKVYRAAAISDDGMTLVASNGISGENWISRDGGTVDSFGFMQNGLNKDWTKTALSGDGEKVITVSGQDAGRIYVGKATTTTVVTSTMTNTSTATTMTTMTISETTTFTTTMTMSTSMTSDSSDPGPVETTTAEAGSVIQITLTLTVDDPASITENEEVKTAMVSGFASAMGVEASQVALTFQVSRRLATSRMLQVQLVAIFSVTFASAQEAQQSLSTVEAVSVAEINTAITNAVAAVPSFTGTIEVTGKQVEIVTEEEDTSATSVSQKFALALLGSLLAPIF